MGQSSELTMGLPEIVTTPDCGHFPVLDNLAAIVTKLPTGAEPDSLFTFDYDK